MNKGYMMVDALICVLISVYISCMCIDVYRSIDNYDKGYISYIEESDDYYSQVYMSLDDCEPCSIDEYD